MSDVLLRDITSSDLERIFDDQRDPVARRMAAFGAEDAEDREAFDLKWHRIFADDSIRTRAIELDGELVGYLVCFEMSELRQVGYWISRAWWGRGAATRALELFLMELEERPLYACAAADNVASIRVLEKCGFVLLRHGQAFAKGRGEQVDEVVMVLRRGGVR
jgi:RimJ/RimL family protein N-acetyltransferase